MAVRVFVGGENFDELRRRHCYYVDKTELLYELVNNNDNYVTLFTRPRRFGKTLTMRMIESFFDINRDSRDVFEGLDIMKHEAFCAEWRNKYPVLFITLKDAEALRFETAYEMLQTIIADVCKRHAYLEKSEHVNREDIVVFKRLMAQEGKESDVQNSLLLLSRMMNDHYGRPVILLIDEYDVPLSKASEEKEAGERYYGQMLSVIRGLMSTVLKTNDYLKFAVVTGCMRIAKESIFTGVNNFASYSVLDADFSQYFGFTQSEVDRLLALTGLEGKAGIFKEWYDGYIFGNEAVYCPWDVVRYAADLLKRSEAKPKPYWGNSSSNSILRDFVGRREFRVKGKFETLMNGGTIIQAISDALTYDTLHETEDNLWSVLLMTGYLSKADPEEDGETVTLRIPNKEVAKIFQSAVVRFFSDTLDKGKQLSLMEALWSGEEAKASEVISDLLWHTISYNDYQEDYYHAFLAGIFVGIGYEVDSNKERGLGRPDIKLTDYDSRRVIIIEAKKSSSRKEMEHDCDEALQQIVDREYAKNLDAYKVTCYGIAFFQKTALVKAMK